MLSESKFLREGKDTRVKTMVKLAFLGTEFCTRSEIGAEFGENPLLVLTLHYSRTSSISTTFPAFLTSSLAFYYLHTINLNDSRL